MVQNHVCDGCWEAKREIKAHVDGAAEGDHGGNVDAATVGSRLVNEEAALGVADEVHGLLRVCDNPRDGVIDGEDVVGK